MRSPSSVDALVPLVPLRRSLAPTWRGWGALLVWAGVIAATAVAPSPTGMGLCVAISLALAVGAISVVVSCVLQAGRLRGSLSGPELVPRGEEARLRLDLVGPTPSFGCRLCFDRSSVHWRRKGAESTGSRGGVRSRHLAPHPRGRVQVVAVEPGRSTGPSLPSTRRTSGSWCTATVDDVAVPTEGRGVQVCHGAALWLYDALGLVGVRLATFPDLAVVVHPASIRSLLDVPSFLPGQFQDQETVLGKLTRSEGEDVIGLRHYQPGDRLSSVHWRSVVGATPLLVRELGRTQATLPRLILDDRAGVHRRAAFEAALDFMANTLVRPAMAELVVELCSLTSGDVLSVTFGAPTAALLRWLAVVEPRRVTGLGAGGSSTQWHHGPSDTVITTATAAESLALLQDLGVRLMVIQ